VLRCQITQPVRNGEDAVADGTFSTSATPDKLARELIGFRSAQGGTPMRAAPAPQWRFSPPRTDACALKVFDILHGLPAQARRCRASRAYVRKFGKHALVGIEGMR